MKITMKKAFLLTFLLTSSALVACGGDDDDTGDQADDGDGGDDGGDDGDDGGDDGPDGGANEMPALGAQIERMGRPAINTAINAAFEPDSDTRNQQKDAYNQDDDVANWPATYSGEFQEQLSALDSLDGTCGNQIAAGDPGPGRHATLAGALADDQLYVNSASGTCTTYLGVEANALGIPNEDCGGRVTSYDVIDVSYSVLATGALSGVSDNINDDDAEPDPNTFPFLAAPL
jgi:Domain of unknown function (DUF4331)